MSEPIYTQQDMDIAHNVLFKLKQEKLDLMRLVWALIYSAGGQICVTREALIEVGAKNHELIKIDDHANHAVIYKAVTK